MYEKEINIKTEICLYEPGDTVKYKENPADMRFFEIVDVEFGEDDLNNCERFDSILLKISSKDYYVQVKYKKPESVFYDYITEKASVFELIKDVKLKEDPSERLPKVASEINKRLRSVVYKDYSQLLDAASKIDKEKDPYYNIIEGIISNMKIFPEDYIQICIKKYGIEKLKEVKDYISKNIYHESVVKAINSLFENIQSERVVESDLPEPGHSNLVDKLKEKEK